MSSDSKQMQRYGLILSKGLRYFFIKLCALIVEFLISDTWPMVFSKQSQLTDLALYCSIRTMLFHKADTQLWKERFTKEKIITCFLSNWSFLCYTWWSSSGPPSPSSPLPPVIPFPPSVSMLMYPSAVSANISTYKNK